MKTQKGHTIFKSFGYALDGIRGFFGKERNAKIQLMAFFACAILGFYFNLTRYEWLAIVGITALVLCLEMTNSAIETILDLTHPEKHHMVKRAKDLMAGAVLVAAIASVVIAAVVFVPYLTN